jgi:hypothetical protein
MARTKAGLNEGTRLADYLAASLLARVFPAERVNEALDAHDANSRRVRRFPAVAGVYYVVALSLYPECSYEAVFSAVAEGLAWAARSPAPAPVGKSSISELRIRIGADPLRDLMRTCCLPLADERQQPEAFYKGLRLVAIDGTRMELPDEVAVAQEFGRPGSRTGHAGYPQAQCVALAECATHAILSAEIGPYNNDEWTLSQYLLGALEPGMLCLADRGYNSAEHWQQALASGAQLLWRAAEGRHLPVLQALPDGSYLSQIEPSAPVKRRRAASEPGAQCVKSAVRVIEYLLPGVPDAQSRYRLITSLLDPVQAPAQELAALYHQRWRIELLFDELKTHLHQARRTLRSKTPELVRQEFYGWVLAHYAVRWLLHQGAARSGLQAQDLSFTAHIHLIKREQPRSGAFPPTAPQTAPSLVDRRARRQRQTDLRSHAAGATSANGQATQLTVSALQALDALQPSS